MKRTERRGTAALFTLLCAWPRASLAEPHLHGVGAVSLGFTDNELAAPSNPAPGAPGPVAVAFTDLRPGLLLLVESPRVAHRVRFTNATSLFFGHSEANSYSNTADWSVFFILGRHTDLILTLGATQGRLNTFSTLQGASSTQVAAQSTGGVSFFTPSAQQGLNVELSPFWRASESLLATAYLPFDAALARTAQADMHLGVDRVFKYDSLGLDLRGGYAVTTAATVSSAAGAPTTPQPVGQIIAGASLRWRHDLSPRWSSELSSGVVEAMRAQGGARVIGPTALAALRYTSENGQGELSYLRTMQPNIFIGQNFFNDTVTLRGAVPLAKGLNFIAAASAGYQHGRAIDIEAGALSSTVDVVLADVSVSWIPTTFYNLSLRFQRSQQRGRATDPVPIASFDRDVVLLTFTGIYPPLEKVPNVQFQLPSRVDQNDLLRGTDNSSPSDNGGSSSGGDDESLRRAMAQRRGAARARGAGERRPRKGVR